MAQTYCWTPPPSPRLRPRSRWTHTKQGHEHAFALELTTAPPANGFITPQDVAFASPEPLSESRSAEDGEVAEQSTDTVVEHQAHRIPSPPRSPERHEGPTGAMPTYFREIPILPVPGVWGARPGSKKIQMLDLSIELDANNAEAADRWSAQDTVPLDQELEAGEVWFDPRERHIVVNLVSLPAPVVATLLDSIPPGSGPDVVAATVASYETVWPARGKVIVEVNHDAELLPEKKRVWVYEHIEGPLDITAYLRYGSNTIRILPLDSMDEYVFFLLARYPTAEETQLAEQQTEWRRSLGSMLRRTPVMT
ncbi:hypothetical protein PUNSTDRAFT_133636 [Punctularia strigosozonata HHB-11173 SS5]|uniref:uncharacterized protein n=1 Tax=Punctularia strigosozonata (strain HHB-11173) TaxID=741275 RepID=UPI0004417B4A|nr:uncharacterized protein PUNSTDRAFT_133636 [Punctularia strigosozonata HHB-11173 SS5]EIN09864.1 hypothetical protein PUNSTDRAFT_133636 [Punctularia strigosozonata HHB-11173 SS5]